MRTGPGVSYTRKGYINPGTYTIVKTTGTWGLVQETGYWVCLEYTTKVSDDGGNSGGNTGSSYQVKVNTAALNTRTGPGTNYSSKGLLLIGSKCTIIRYQGRLGPDERKRLLDQA